MTENLYNLLSGHGFLDTAVELTEVTLLCHKEAAALGTDFLHRNQHNPNHQQCNQCQRHIQHKHGYQHTYYGNGTVQKLWYTLTDHLAHGVNIIRIHGHDVAVSMGIKILNRQLFHFFKHIVSELHHGSLRHKNHYS